MSDLLNQTGKCLYKVHGVDENQDPFKLDPAEEAVPCYRARGEDGTIGLGRGVWNQAALAVPPSQHRWEGYNELMSSIVSAPTGGWACKSEALTLKVCTAQTEGQLK